MKLLIFPIVFGVFVAQISLGQDLLNETPLNHSDVVIGDLPLTGELTQFVDKFKEVGSVRGLQQSVSVRKSRIVKHYMCPNTLTLVRLDIVIPIDKSRYSILLSPVSKVTKTDFREVSVDWLLKCGVNCEVLFKAFEAINYNRGMGQSNSIFELRVREGDQDKLRQRLILELDRIGDLEGNSGSGDEESR